MNYETHYDTLNERARNRVLEGYTERHHVVPRCMGGSDNANNIVRLTAEEHYVAHQLLVKIYPENNKLIYAANMMSVGRINNRKYGWLKKKHAKVVSENMKARYAAGFENPSRRPEVRKKISEAAKARAQAGPSPLKGRILSKEMREKLSKASKGKKKNYPAWNKGIKRPDISAAMTGKKWFNNGKRASRFGQGEEPNGWTPGKKLRTTA